jgi:hypothetical protein
MNVRRPFRLEEIHLRKLDQEVARRGRIEHVASKSAV